MTRPLRESAWWLDVGQCEERAHLLGMAQGLCHYVWAERGQEIVVKNDRLQLFRPEYGKGMMFWWPLGKEDSRGQFSDRVLACCFLSAMALYDERETRRRRR